MIARGGAMALFVLRLAGLLSFEKSLFDNSTSVAENSTIPTFSPRNVSLDFPELSNNVTESPLMRKGGLLESPNFSFWKVQSTHNDTAENLLVPVPIVSQPVLVNKNQTGKRRPSKRTEDKKKDKINNHGKEVRKLKSSKLPLDKELLESLEDDGSTAVKKTGDEKKPPVNGEPRGENRANLKSGVPMPSKITTWNETDRNVEFVNAVETTSLPPRNTHTGFSPLYTKEVNNRDLPYYANAPSKVPYLFGTATVPIVNGSSANSSSSNFQGLEGPETYFLETKFDYYDYYGNESMFIPPTLSSRSLISPVPRPGEEESYKEYYGRENQMANKAGTKENDAEAEGKSKGTKVDQQVEHSNNAKEATTINGKDKKKDDGKEKKMLNSTNNFDPDKKSNERFRNTKVKTTEPTQTNIDIPMVGLDLPGHINISEPKRNNPYPYGPKFIPRQSLVSYDNPKNGPELQGNFFPEKDLVYDYDDYNASGPGVFFVKTDKPPVLFHFNKPGYSPKMPESSLPPTRAPTPSDPWDCSPRCPRYILLDWNPDYDIRQYPTTTWISTVIIAENRILAELEGYMRVQDFFYGLNDRGQLLNITVPFVTQIKHGQHPGVLKEVTDYTVSLYINHEDDPLNYDLPTPISNEVLIDRLESKTVFVAGFEAFVWEVTESFLNEKVEHLSEKLRQNGEAFLDRYFYLASYNRPELYQPLYYELWIYATTFRDNVATQQVPPMAPRRRPPPNHITAKTINKLCRGVECPSFEVLRTYRYGIQKRRYFDGVFVTTSPGVCQFSTLAVWKGFMPLHLYKHGINSHMEVIEATRPIALVHVKEDSTSLTECPQNLTMAIYLPKRLHSNPPLTGYDAPRVEVSALQDVVVYAYTVGGYLLEPDRVRKELADLKHRLTEFGACFKHDEYYIVVYDFIVRYHGRQNEIWVVAENCKATKNG